MTVTRGIFEVAGWQLGGATASRFVDCCCCCCCCCCHFCEQQNAILAAPVQRKMHPATSAPWLPPLHVPCWFAAAAAATQNGRSTAFALLEDCQQLAAASAAAGHASRLLLGLQEPVLGLCSGDAAAIGVEVETRKRRYRLTVDTGGGSACLLKQCADRSVCRDHYAANASIALQPSARAPVHPTAPFALHTGCVRGEVWL
eukprot:GHRQ01031609.1.p1 GENE.GHRQ01031609.1~~GHRQ01031609.1.p1  ORF type:complete len:201 (+),score=42.28 GHRQ01031609.1:1257-1859(+)